MELKYGPQTYQIEKLLEKIKSLTPEQIKSLSAANSAAASAADSAARWAADSAARWAAYSAARWAAYSAGALALRHLIGEKFTQAHYDLLTKPWRDVMGEFEEPEIEVPVTSCSCHPSSIIQSESEKFFAKASILLDHIENGEVSLEATGWVEDSNGGPSKKLWPHYFQVVVTPKEVGE